MDSKTSSSSSSVIEHKAYARVGLLGNPSDVYHGRTISFAFSNFWASVQLRPSDELVITPHPTHDFVHFRSLDHLINRLSSEGYYGGVRLLMAICKVFYSYCREKEINLHTRNFTLSYDTNIPRQAGLSGSSAIVCAALSCLLDFFDVRHLIKVEVRPKLVLAAEKELGIVAGLQDRVAQVYGGLVHMDFSQEHMEKLGHGIYTPMDINLLPPLYLIYADNPSDSGKVHSTVRQRWLDGDKFIISSMQEVAKVAEEGRTALLEKDYSKLAMLMNRNFDLRRSMFGDDVLGALNIEMVEVARRVGAASKKNCFGLSQSRLRVFFTFTVISKKPTMELHYYTHRNQSHRAALAAVFLLLFPLFLPNLFHPLGRASPSLFSEWISPKPRHTILLDSALHRITTFEDQKEIWSPLSNQGWKPCLKPTRMELSQRKSQGYIQVFLDGGLNQQRMGICDAVAVARILNATLIIPHLEINAVWKDSSSFGEIFDVDHFIDVLRDDISIVKELPTEYSWSTREYYATGIRSTRIKTAPTHASANWYLENVLPIMQSYGIAAIAPFSHRLSFNDLPTEIQHLRCKVNFMALAFVRGITELGDTIINRLRYSSNQKETERVDSLLEDEKIQLKGGKFVVLHLRFDKDMAAHSACEFGGGKAERLALAKYRQVIWQGRVPNSQFTDEELRYQGRCPLTPEEIGLLLAALGFSNTTRVYLAIHEVYGGEARISTLRKVFPLLEDKKSLTSPMERAGVAGKASLSAAVDYYVSLHSDVFISASPGNMHNALLGHRAYLNMKTIRPNMVLLGPLFLNKSMEWSEFKKAVLTGHRNRQGQIRLRKETQSIYTYPAPDCMCPNV